VQKQSTKKERLRLQFAKERVSKNKRAHLFPLGCTLSKVSIALIFGILVFLGFRNKNNVMQTALEREKLKIALNFHSNSSTSLFQKNKVKPLSVTVANQFTVHM
jgi:hypothetical protein